MSLARLVAMAADKSRFLKLTDYIDFCRRYLDFLAADGLQAVIVSQNEQQYRFFQYKTDGHFNITRPINSDLFMSRQELAALSRDLVGVIKAGPDIVATDEVSRALIRRGIYTLQQSIGGTLDALPSGASNTARKVNGDLFERLIRLLISETGVDCESGTINVPVLVDGVEQFKMSYQHDLIVREGGAVKAIGGVKTSSKDRLGKIFVDKFLYSRLTETQVPHIAIFLNDVQRKNTKTPNRYGVSATFLPGHFKGFTIKLNPLDGVYYCDIRPNMRSDPLLAAHIRTIDHFFCTDLWTFVEHPGDKVAVIDAKEPKKANGGAQAAGGKV
jgi:hypothetical protein